MEGEEKRRRKVKTEGVRKEGGGDVGEEYLKSSSMQGENAGRKKGNLWVKTCFLGKGLSPSKLSTKALCGNTRKRGNEKPKGN